MYVYMSVYIFDSPPSCSFALPPPPRMRHSLRSSLTPGSGAGAGWLATFGSWPQDPAGGLVGFLLFPVVDFFFVMIGWESSTSQCDDSFQKCANIFL